MNLSKIVAAASVFIFITSCQKPYEPTDPTTPTTGTTTDSTASRIKTYTEDVTSTGQHSVTTYDVNYDNNNRIISLVSESNAGNKFVYGYGNSVNTLDLYNAGALSIHTELYLNGNALVDSAFQYDDTQDTTTDKYSYNSAKQLIQDITYDFENGVRSVDDEFDYTWDTNGNVSQEIDDEGTTTYEYYTDKINNIRLTTSFSFTNKNLIKTTTFDDGSGTIITLNHTYTFDSMNRVLSETDTDGTGDIAIKSYTYY